MESNPAEKPTTEAPTFSEEPQNKTNATSTNADTETAVEIEALLKETLKAIGRHSIMAYEIENEQIQLDTIKLNDSAKNPIIANRYKQQQADLSRKNEVLLQEQATSLKCITEVAELYRGLFANRLGEVRDEIESAMIKYCSILSKDTIQRINKESTRLTTVTDEQAKNLETLSNDLTTKTKHLDTKMDEIKTAMATHSEDTAKLFAVNNKCTQATLTLDSKLTTLQQKLAETTVCFEKRITSSISRTETQRTALENISAVISSKIKDDKEVVLRRITELEEGRQSDKKALEVLESELKAIQKQMESLPTSAAAAQNTDTSTTLEVDTLATYSSSPSSLSDKELVNMKAMVSRLQIKSNELFQLLNTLVQTGEHIATSETLENLKANMSLQRLDDVEKNMVYLLSKVEVMEPRHRLEFAELRQLLESKGVLTSDQKIPSLGEKRTRRMARDDEDDDDDEDREDRTLRLEEEVKRVDFKLASLVEYVHQFRSNVLNPSFPDKLDSGLQHMEEILRNHETFIAFLVDPVSAINIQQNDQNSSSALIAKVSDLHKQSDLKSTISPALLTAITKLVADTTKKEYEQQQSKKQKTLENPSSLSSSSSSASSASSSASSASSDTSIPEYMEKYMAQLMTEQVEPLKEKIKDLEKQLQQQQQ